MKKILNVFTVNNYSISQNKIYNKNGNPIQQLAHYWNYKALGNPSFHLIRISPYKA